MKKVVSRPDPEVVTPDEVDADDWVISYSSVEQQAYKLTKRAMTEQWVWTSFPRRKLVVGGDLAKYKSRTEAMEAELAQGRYMHVYETRVEMLRALAEFYDG